MNQQETLRLLREAHEEPIAEAHYAAVRARVLSQLAAQRRPWRAWAFGLAATATLAILFAVAGRTPRSAPSLAQQFVPQSQHQVISERPGGGPGAGKGVRPTLGQSAKTRAPGRWGGLRASGRRIDNPPQVANLPRSAPTSVIGPPVAQPLTVKLMTDDPNIVIYWISGE